MRLNAHSRSIPIITLILILLLSPAVTPAFAEDNPPPEPTPAVEETPPAEENTTPTDSTSPTEPTPQAEEPAGDELPPVDTPDEPVADCESGEDIDPNDEAPPASEETDSEPMVPAGLEPSPLNPDPYYTFDGETYRFSGGLTYCDDNYPLDPNCTQNLPNPFQFAIDDLSGRGLPIDGSGSATVFVEDGAYGENVTIDGTTWGGSLLSSLTVQSLNGSGSTSTLSMIVQNMLDFFLQGFTLTNGLSASGNTGTFSLTDVVASNTTGTGITVFGQDGDILLDSVQANNNGAMGANLNNSTGSGDITITDSQFNVNNTTSTATIQAGLMITSDNTVTLNNVQANGNLHGDGASIGAETIVINGGSFNNNTSPMGNWGNGLVIQTFGGGIRASGITASNNEESGAELFYSASAVDPANLITVENSSLKSNGQFGVWAQPESGTVELRCVCMSDNGWGNYMVPVGETVVLFPCPDKDEEVKGSKYPFVGVLLSTEEPKIVNATNGVLVTFPPIQIIDPEELAIGKVWPRKEYQLPAEIAEGDTFMAGVEVQMINAEFIQDLEDGDLLIEFFIPGYLVEREFSVLWWDMEAEQWVDIPFEFVPHDRLPGGKIVARWPETGTFILVLHPLTIEP
jgi:hypothetical protein